MTAVVVATVMGLAFAECASKAQGPVDAGLRGRVLTAQGRPMAGVQIVVANVDGATQKIMSAKDGTFLLLRLSPGEYDITTQGDSEKVELHAGEIRDLLMRANPNARRSSTDSELQREAGEEYTYASIGSFPLSDNAWESVERVDSTANASVNDSARSAESNADDASAGQSAEENVRASDGEAASGASSDGLPVTGDDTTADGLSARQNFGAGARGVTPGGVHAGATFGENTVREFRTLPRTFSAQYGGTGGGVSVVLQGAEHGGPGAWHGAAFFEARESAWAAVNPFSVVTHYRDGVVTNSLVRPQDVRQQFGGQMGWSLPQRFLPPGLKRGVSVFASVEEQTSEETVESTPQLASFYDVAAQTALLANRGVSGSAINAALNYLDSLSGSVAETATRTLTLARVNLQPASRDHITLGYIHNQFNAPAGVALGQGSGAVVARGRGSVGESALRIDAATTRWLHQFLPRVNYELRAQLAHDLEYETPHAPLPQEPAIGPGGLTPQVSIGPQGFAYGTPSNLGRLAYPDEHRIELASLLQIAWRGHLISVGGEWSRIEDRIASFNNADGSFTYDGPTTATSNGVQESGLANWITDYTFNVNAYPNGGCPSINAQPHYFCFHTFTQSFGPVQTEFITHEFAGLAEVAFRIGSDVTVTLGARYEYTLLPLPQAPNYTLDTALLNALSASAPATEQFPEDRNNVGPRVALAWSPHLYGGAKKGSPLVTIHAGYGIFFGKIAGATVRQALIDTAMPSTALNIRIRPATTTSCPQMPSVGFGYPCAYVTVPPAAVQQTSQAIVFAKNFRLPQVQRATFEMERTVGRHVWVRAFYSMAIAEQLAQSVDVNIAPSPAEKQFVIQGGNGHMGVVNGQMFRLPLYTSRLLTQYGPVTEIESSANATYHSGTLEARWRGAGFEVRAGYTFSRAIDYAPMTGAVPRTNGQLDPFTNGYDKGLSGLNFPQRFAGDLIYKVKMERGQKQLRALLNGVRVATIAQAGSGAPYSYGVYGGSYLGGGSDSINGSGGATYLPTVGRNTLRLPARSNVDARVSRSFHVGKHAHAEGFVEAFNLLNTVQLTRVETRAFLVGTPTVTNGITGPTPLIFQDAATVAAEGLTTPSFGTPLSSTSGSSRERELELGVRVEF